MQILARWREDGPFITRARPGNAISGDIKWERWSKRKICIFYEAFPLLPLGSLWLSTSNRIPSSLIPFSKNVIEKSPFGLSITLASSCVGTAAQSYIIKSLNLYLITAVSPHLVGPSGVQKSHTCVVRASCLYSYACLFMALTVRSQLCFYSIWKLSASFQFSRSLIVRHRYH